MLSKEVYNKLMEIVDSHKHDQQSIPEEQKIALTQQEWADYWRRCFEHSLETHGILVS